MFNTELQNHEYMQFVLTHACNRVCKFCIDHKRGANEYMTEAALRRGLAFAQERGIKQLLYVGGEPTLHPQFRYFCSIAQEAGFNLVVTTNFDDTKAIYEALDVVDSWNFSYYGQKAIPRIPEADITLSGLIYAKGFLSTQVKLDAFIDSFADHYHLKFSTLTVVNDYTAKVVDPGPWLDDLPGERLVLFDFICAQTYRGHLIKRYDVEGPDLPTLDSYKCLVDGAITRSWVDRGPRQLDGMGALRLEEVISAHLLTGDSK
jgi:organic radical activating enzyme